VSAIFYENTLCNKITLEILESDYGGDLFIYDDFLLGYQIRKNGISENCLFSKEMTKPILLSNGFGSHVSFTKIGSKRFIFRFSNEDDFNNDWIEVYGDIHRTNLLYKFDNANYFFFFGNDDLLFFYEFNDRFKINCVSAIDGKPLWHKSINDKYWFDRLGNTFPASLNTGKGTLVGEKCILSVMNHGILCLNSITGEVFYEDFNKEFYSYDNFKVYGNKYFHFIYDQNYFPFIRCADADTGIEIYCKKITDVIPSISDENIRNINSHNQSLFFNIHNGYLFFTDWEYLYLLKEDDATLIDSIKIPFVDGVPNGNRSEIKMHGNRIYLNAASTTLDKYDLYVFELDEY
jgi:hypothetical protein